MSFTGRFVIVIATAALLSASAASVAMAQEQAVATGSQNVLTESFDGDDQSLMLGGQIDLLGDSTPWLIYVADGHLVMENRQNPKSLHYNDIAWVKYPNAEILTSTENSVISAVVGAQNVGNGGAGILVGSGKAGNYLMFSVDGQGRYHILKKEGRKLRAVHSAKHAAIAVGGPNELTFLWRGANIVLVANGAEITQIPYPRPITSSRRLSGQAGIGLAAFGIGTFTFDSVEIVQAD